jgi:hypothetical protein
LGRIYFAPDPTAVPNIRKSSQSRPANLTGVGHSDRGRRSSDPDDANEQAYPVLARAPRRSRPNRRSKLLADFSRW